MISQPFNPPPTAQVGAFGTPGRDPRGWCITVAFAALVPTTQLGVKAADDAAEAEWFPITALPQPLAFDHKEIVRAALVKLGEQRQAADIGACDGCRRDLGYTIWSETLHCKSGSSFNESKWVPNCLCHYGHNHGAYSRAWWSLFTASSISLIIIQVSAVSYRGLHSFLR